MLNVLWLATGVLGTYEVSGSTNQSIDGIYVITFERAGGGLCYEKEKGGEKGGRCASQGGAEYEDVRAARTWLDADRAPRAVGIHGLSYGGLNCLQALARDSPQYVGGACNAPVFNWLSDGRSHGLYDWGSPSGGGWRQEATGPEPDLASPAWEGVARANAELAWRSSPAAFVENWTSPVLLLHGDADANVAFQESRGVLRALRRKGGVHVETFVRPDETHGMALYEHQLAAARATFAFLARFLGA